MDAQLTANSLMRPLNILTVSPLTIFLLFAINMYSTLDPAQNVRIDKFKLEEGGCKLKQRIE
jgi:hypothetical protein